MKFTYACGTCRQPARSLGRHRYRHIGSDCPDPKYGPVQAWIDGNPMFIPPLLPTHGRWTPAEPDPDGGQFNDEPEWELLYPGARMTVHPDDWTE